MIDMIIHVSFPPHVSASPCRVAAETNDEMGEAADNEGEDQVDDRLAVSNAGMTTTSEAALEVRLASPKVCGRPSVELSLPLEHPWWWW